MPGRGQPYDAASNITQKVQSVYVTETPTTTTPTPTTSGIGGNRDTPTPGSGATENPTSAPTTVP